MISIMVTFFFVLFFISKKKNKGKRHLDNIFFFVFKTVI
jgi:hypothetical protein